MKKLVLLDANHLMHRAYWAIQRSLATSKGEQTNAVFGVASMLLTLLAREHPDAIVACFDAGDDTFRHKDHEAYKAGRAETPDDFYVQIPRVHQCMAAFGIPTIADAKYEADDFIGTLAAQGVKEGFEVTIVTGDKDLFQMASEHIQIAVPHKGYAMPEYLDPVGVEAKLGVSPQQIPDYKGLTGDASDNLKGVKGIGPKTTVELLQKYSSLEGIYEHLPEIRESVRAKLAADRDSAFLCKRLATLVTDAPLPIALQETVHWHGESAAIDSFFQEIEFFTLRRRFRRFLEEDPYGKTHFRGELSPMGTGKGSKDGGREWGNGDLPDVPLKEEKGMLTEAQLPLLD